MFTQILCSFQLDTPCLQQSRKTETRCVCLCFEKKNTRRVCRRFHEANIVVIPCGRTLRRSQNNRNVRTCFAKSLTGVKLYVTTANKCQHCCGSMQKDATSYNIVGSNIVACCWPTMLRPFARGLKRDLRPVQTNATSHNIVGPNNVGSCWHLPWCMQTNATTANIVGVTSFFWP